MADWTNAKDLERVRFEMACQGSFLGLEILLSAAVTTFQTWTAFVSGTDSKILFQLASISIDRRTKGKLAYLT